MQTCMHVQYFHLLLITLYMNDEHTIACKLIDYLEAHYNFDFIAREVPFSKGSRRADIVAANKKDGISYAYEIKSDIDTLLRLKGQLEAYRTTFNYVNVVTTKKYVSAVKNFGLWFGIMILENDGSITVKRKPRKRLLTKETYNRPQIKNSDKNCNTSYVNWLCERYEPLYDLFVKERPSTPTTKHDIRILSLRSDRIILP